MLRVLTRGLVGVAFLVVAWTSGMEGGVAGHAIKALDGTAASMKSMQFRATAQTETLAATPSQQLDGQNSGGSPQGLDPAYSLDFQGIVMDFDSDGGPLPSWPKRNVRYTTAGELSPNVDAALEKAMTKISRYTGLEFERSNTADIMFIFDKRAIIDAHEYPDRLRFLGMDEAEIRVLQKSIGKPDSPGGQSCGGTAFVKSANDISFSLGLAQDVSEKCIFLSVFPAVGVRFRGDVDEARGLKMACLLYRGRALGARSIPALVEKKNQLEADCLKAP